MSSGTFGVEAGVLCIAGWRFDFVDGAVMSN